MRGSPNNKKAYKHQLRRLESKDWQVCFLSPERLQSWARSGYLRKLREMGIDPNLVVLDEMHCLEEWREFRPGYQELFERVKSWLSRDSIFLGMSASLPEKESKAWMQELCGSYTHVAGGLGRANLHLRVVPLQEEGLRWLLLISALRDLRAPESALVYCGTRRETEEATRWLRSAGIDAVAYHAGLPLVERVQRSKNFREGHLRVICATSAFGMGIDYPHVSLVIHFTMPYDLESYWQEVGRAGRAGEPAHAIAFWRRSEISRLRSMRNNKAAQERFVSLWRAWASGECRKRSVALRLGLAQENCGTCDRCSENSKFDFFIPSAWWVEPAALPEEWLEEKIKAMSGRDASPKE